MTNDKIKNLIKEMMKWTLCIYFLCVAIIIIVKGFITFVDDGLLLENVMLNYRTYLFGLIVAKEKFLFAKFEPVQIFAIHFTIFFALFFYYVIFYNKRREDQKFILKSFLLIIVAVLIIVLTRLRFPFCLPYALILSGIINIIITIFGARINESDVRIIKVFKIALSFFSVICLVYEFASYFI